MSILDWFGRNLLAYPPQQGGDPSTGYANPLYQPPPPPGIFPGTQHGLLRLPARREPVDSFADKMGRRASPDIDPRGTFGLPPAQLPGSFRDELEVPLWDERVIPKSMWPGNASYTPGLPNWAAALQAHLSE